MLARHIMTSPAIVAPTNMPVLEATRLMKEKKINRLPVVDNGKLVGIVTKDRLLRSAPSDATSLSLHEIHYLYGKLTLGEIMKKNPHCVSPDMTLEAVAAFAQEKNVGSLPVVEDGKVVGIVTTNDIFYVVVNPILGIGEDGSRIVVRNCNSTKEIMLALECVEKEGLSLVNSSYIRSKRGEENDFYVHISEEDPTGLVACMKEQGLDAEVRARR
ncbi:MAG: acetoin utilization protein [Deltaproteobacteria bacterium]|nr:MAG: acetoin utilization protein [Deltaproteobacteria bacterium]